MMTVEMKRAINEMKAGDAAVDGLLGGLLAGVVMVITLLLLGLISGSNAADILNRFDPSNAGSPLVGVLLHLAISGIYGILYGILCWMFLRRWLASHSSWVNILVGVFYGLVLWVSAQAVVLPISGSALSGFPAWQFALAHLLFGGVLGWSIWRSLVKYTR
jgi:hypothetical protein